MNAALIALLQVMSKLLRLRGQEELADDLAQVALYVRKGVAGRGGVVGMTVRIAALVDAEKVPPKKSKRRSAGKG